MENNRERLDIKSTKQTFYANQTDFFKTSFSGGTTSSDGKQCSFSYGGTVLFQVDFDAFHKYSSIKSIKLRLTSPTKETGQFFDLKHEYSMSGTTMSSYSLGVYGCNESGVFEIEILNDCEESQIYRNFFSCFFLGNVTIYTASAAKAYRPQLIVEYIDDKESILNQKTVGGSVGRALNYNVNVRTGRPTFTKPLLNIKTTALPINLELYFDPLQANETDYYMPKGWRFNYQQKLISNSEGYEYIDGSGLRHQFKTSYNNSNVFYDIAGTGLILTKSGSTYTIDNGYKQTLTFDSYGRLKKIIKTVVGLQFGLQFSYVATSDNISTIYEYRKPSGATSETLTQKVSISYTGSYGFSIYSTGFPTVSVSVDSDYNLTAITEEDSRVSTYGYDDEGLLSLAKSDNGEKTLFDLDARYRMRKVNDYIAAKVEGNDDAEVSSMAFYYKYLSTEITNYFGVKMGYSFNDEGELIGEYEITSDNKYVNMRVLNRTDEYSQISINSAEASLGYEDVRLSGNTTQITKKTISSSTALSVGKLTPNTTEYFNLSFIYRFAGASAVGENVNSYVAVMQGGEELARVTLSQYHIHDTLGSLTFKCKNASSLQVVVGHDYNYGDMYVKNINIHQTDLVESYVCINYQTSSPITDDDPADFVIDSDKYYKYNCECFTCNAVSGWFYKKMYYEDLIENQKNIAITNVTRHIWYNKKRGLMANDNYAQIPGYLEGDRYPFSVDELRVATITVNKNQYLVSYSDYSSSEALRIDYNKIMIKNDTETVNKTLLQSFVDKNYQTFKTIDEKGIINLKTFDSYGHILSESLKNSTDSNSIVTNYTYGSNQQLQSESVVINGTTHRTTYVTNYYTGRLESVTYPNGLVENISKIDGTIEKFKKLSANVNGVNSNEISYNTRKDLVEKYQAHANGLSLTYDDYNLVKEFKNYDHIFWTKARSLNSNGYSETTSYDNNTFKRITSYDKYGNLYDITEEKDGSRSSVLQLFYSDFDADNITQTDPNHSTLNKKSNSKLRKKVDTILDDITSVYYDNKGNVSKEKHTKTIYKPTQITYTMDDFNRPKNKQTVLSNGNVFAETVQYKNDYNKEIESYFTGVMYDSISFDNVGATITHEEDNLGRIISETTTIGSTVFKKQYTYQGTSANSTNLISKMVITRNGVTLETYNYTYDNMGRITNITNTSGSVNNRYKYDLLGRLIREDNEELNATTLFEYDTNGNMLNKSVAVYSTSDTVTTNPPHAFTVSLDYADYITSYNGKAITTSSTGNITSVGTTTYLWTRSKLLSKVQKSDTEYVNYNYDGEGLRISKSHYNNGVTTTHTYIRDGKKILVEKINNGTTEKVLNYLYLGENVIGFVYNNAYYHFQKNLQNDIIAIYNESGTKVAAYEYDAWGNHTITLDTNSIGSLNPFRYRGYYYDSEDNLYHCNSRYYSPELCRFMSPDSIRYINSRYLNGFNLYCYCYNNPVMYSDPSGCFAIGLFALVLGCIAIGMTNLGGATGALSAALSGGSFSDIYKGYVQGKQVGAMFSVGLIISMVGFKTGFGTLLGSSLVTYGTSIVLNYFEIIVSQSKKSLSDGDNVFHTLNDIIKAMHSNSLKAYTGYIHLDEIATLNGTKFYSWILHASQFAAGYWYDSILDTPTVSSYFNQMFLTSNRKTVFFAGFTIAVQVGFFIYAVSKEPNEEKWKLY